MRRPVRIVVMFLWAVTLGCLALAAGTIADQIVTRDRDGYLPAVTVIKRSTPAGAQLCAERLDGDFVDCQSIGEVRKWLYGRAAALK